MSCVFIEGAQVGVNEFHIPALPLSHWRANSFQTSETAYLQGIDLYGEQAKRLVAAMEFHADYITGKTVPKWLCGGTINSSLNPTWEIGYNHYHNRLGMTLPISKTLIETKLRPTGVDHHMAWESLTHAELGMVGVMGVGITTRKLGVQHIPVRIIFGRSGSIKVAWTRSVSAGAIEYSLVGRIP